MDDDLRKLMDQMLETMYSAPGIGLAAVYQIGIKTLSLLMFQKEFKKILYFWLIQKLNLNQR